MDLKQISEIVIYIIPGFIAMSITYFCVPTRRHSDFERLIWSIILSLPIYGITNYGINPLITRYPHIRILLFIFVSWPLAVITGWILAAIRKSKWYPKILAKVLSTEVRLKPRVWNEVFDFPEEADYVKVYLSNGLIYIGVPLIYSLDPNDPDKELFLNPAWLIKELPDKEPEVFIVDKGVYVPASNIISVEFLKGVD